MDRKSAVPLHRQLEASIREAILSGRLEPGERILSSRDLRVHLGLSRNTIVAALTQLQAEGYLTFVRGVGTFVADALQYRMHAATTHDETEFLPSRAAAAFVAAQDLAANQRLCAPFRPGIPALDLFPAAQFKRAFDSRSWSGELLDYPPAFGDERLRSAIARRLRQTRGIACTPDQVLVTAGAQAAFALIARVLLNERDAVLVEEPGYPSVQGVLLAHGAQLVPAPVDDAGVEVARFASVHASLIHVTPSHQYPTGAVLSLERRLALLDWAKKNETWIVEDDYDSEFSYTGRPQPALQGLDGGRRVLYVGTFSKVLAPALRVAYIVVPRALYGAFHAAQQVLGGQPAAVMQDALATFIETGQFARHVTRMRKVYDERRRAASSEIVRRFGSRARIRDSAAGLHFIVELPKDVSDAAFSRRAAERGIIVPALSSYFRGPSSMNGVVIGFAAVPPAAGKQAIKTLAGLL